MHLRKNSVPTGNRNPFIISGCAWSLLLSALVFFAAAGETDPHEHDGEAQDYNQTEITRDQDGETGTEITDEQLKQAVDIYFELADIYQRLREDLTGIEDEEIIAEKIRQVEKEIYNAITGAGLKEDEYIRIMHTIEADENLLRAFMVKLNRKDPLPAIGQRPPPPLDPETISQRQIEQAAQIYVTVTAISERVHRELAATEDEAAVEKIIAAAEMEILQAAEAAGMEAEEYEKIMRTLQYDRELLKRFLHQAEELTEPVPEP